MPVSRGELSRPPSPSRRLSGIGPQRRPGQTQGQVDEPGPGSRVSPLGRTPQVFGSLSGAAAGLPQVRGSVPCAQRTGESGTVYETAGVRAGAKATPAPPSRAYRRAVNFPVGLGIYAPLSTPVTLRQPSSGGSRLPPSCCPSRERFSGRTSVCVRSGEEHREGDWDNSWSGLCIPVGNTSLYELQDAVGSSGTKRASNVKETQNGRRDAT
ncbi:uncharacterized protein LOC114061795 [Empidonax traillii]|uniref:uncharacterized protein LOC114061795 n=1 Tax=Empidonax traillii TaxID=164674 RepID=UPI000FFCE500|nr:uncharacterized protein LOC114061795 [Empidonax traillii]